MSKQVMTENLKRLTFLEGDWVNAGQLEPGPFGPGGAISGRTSYTWDVCGSWLTYKSSLELPGLGSYEVTGGVSVALQGEEYQAYAANSLGNLIVYEGWWESETRLVFTQDFPAPAGMTRVIYEKLSGGEVRMLSERRSGSGDFEVYFETRMKR